MRLIFVLFVPIFFSACAPTIPQSAQFRPSAYLVEVDQAYIDASLEQVRQAGLRDPYSAQFSGIYTTKKASSQRDVNVCGYVNAKNLYGAYVGRTMFVATPGYAVIWESTTGYSRGNMDIRESCTLRAGRMAQ